MVKIIAEIGCNYQGYFSKALEMINVACNFCNVDIVKFQKRDPKTLLSEEEFTSLHPVPENSFGNTYGEHREFLESSTKEHKLFRNECEKFNKQYSTSVWDIVSAKEIIKFDPSFLKIPSALNQDYKLLDCIYDNFNNDIHISLGMTSKIEEEELINFISNKNGLQRTVLYSCTSAYPVKQPEDIALLEIARLKKEYGKIIKAVGFSGHHLGIAIDIAAVTLGAEYIERHFTLDRTLKGTDHAASLEPYGLRKLCRDVSLVKKSLVHKGEELLKIEIDQRKKLKKITTV